VVTNPPGDLRLAPLNGTPRPLREWLTLFHLAVVVLDPYTSESAWLLPTAGRLLRTYDQADCRVAWLITCDADDARRFLGPWAGEILTFCDPDREAVKALGLERLPAFVHIDLAGDVVGSAEGWDPDEWRAVATELSRLMSWSRPVIPALGDPAPFPGSPALG
jgi:hypothetical protein